MYIHPFVAGVLTTILVFSVGLLLYGFYINHKNSKKDKEDHK